MSRAHVNLDDAAWMCDAAGGAGYADHANARLYALSGSHEDFVNQADHSTARPEGDL